MSYELLAQEICALRSRIAALEGFESPFAAGVLPLSAGGTGVRAAPLFHVHKNGTDQTGIVTGTPTKLTWSSEVFDTNANFASDKFTPTVAGKYWFLSQVFWSTCVDATYLDVKLYKNGALAHVVETYANTTNSQSSPPLFAVLDANGSTDYFEAYVEHGAGSNRTVRGLATATYFMGGRLL